MNKKIVKLSCIPQIYNGKLKTIIYNLSCRVRFCGKCQSYVIHLHDYVTRVGPYEIRFIFSKLHFFFSFFSFFFCLHFYGFRFFPFLIFLDFLMIK